MSTVPTSVKLNTGAYIPVISLGTWKSKPGQVEYAVEYALKSAGYKGIDTAVEYENKKAVGQGIAASGVPREQIFLTKLPNDQHNEVEQSLEESLSRLNTPYLNLWLMHWPAPMNPGYKGADKSQDWVNTWKEMEKLYKAHPDKLKAIVPYLERPLKETTIVPALLPTARDSRLLRHNIVVTSYSPLGSDNSPHLSNPVVTGLAEKYSVSPASILISLQANIPNTTVLPKSVTNERIKSNATIVQLSEDEIASLLSIGDLLSFRTCDPEWTGWGNLGFPDRVKAAEEESK